MNYILIAAGVFMGVIMTRIIEDRIKRRSIGHGYFWICDVDIEEDSATIGIRIPDPHLQSLHKKNEIVLRRIDKPLR